MIFTMIDTDKALVPKSATEKEGSYMVGFYYFGNKSLIYFFLIRFLF